MAESVLFEHYEVHRRKDGSLWELGRGAMGITYRAFDTNLRCDVALKVINANSLASDNARQRFLREARAAAAIRHPNVATVYHLGQSDDAFFYAMEFIDGETVEDFMLREEKIPPLLALDIVDQVARALSAAHKRGLIHRDIKPSNLMLTRDDEDDPDDIRVRVIDFGLAKAADRDSGFDAATITQGGFLGTPHFASPEQLEEAELDVRSDIYSLGVTLYYLLAGKAPFSGSVAQVMSQHLHRSAPLAPLGDQPTAIVDLLRTMLEKDPALRPQTPADLRSRVAACIAGIRDVRHPSILRAPTTEWTAAPSIRTTVSRDGALPAAVAMTILTSIAGGLEALRRAGQPPPPIAADRVKLLPPGTLQPQFEVGESSDDPTRSLAAIAYEILAGHPGNETFEPIPDLPAAANRVLRRALDPNKGYPLPVAFVADLGDALGDACGVVSAPADHEVTIPPPGASTPRIDRLRAARAPRRRVPAWLGAITGVAGLALIYLIYSLQNPPPTPPAPVPTPRPTPPPIPTTPTPNPFISPTPAPSATPSASATPANPVIERARSLAAANLPGIALDVLAQAWERDRTDEELPAEMETLAATIGSQPLTDEAFAALEDPLQHAAEAHSESAQLLLAAHYREAEPALFVKYATMAENDGSPAGARLMAEAYEQGIGVDPDPTKAAEYRRRAGDPPSEPPRSAARPLPTPKQPDTP